MSVVVIARFPTADPDKAVEWARAHSEIPEESFHTFFSEAPRMQEFLTGAGLTSDPVISIYQAVEAPGTFWT